MSPAGETTGRCVAGTRSPALERAGRSSARRGTEQGDEVTWQVALALPGSPVRPAGCCPATYSGIMDAGLSVRPLYCPRWLRGWTPPAHTRWPAPASSPAPRPRPWQTPLHLTVSVR